MSALLILNLLLNLCVQAIPIESSPNKDSINLYIRNFEYQKAINYIDRENSLLRETLTPVDSLNREVNIQIKELTLQKVQSLKKLYRIEEALTSLVELLDPDPTKTDLRTLYEISECNKVLGRFEDALNSISIITLLYPSAFFLTEQASLKFRLKDYPGAITDAHNVLKRNGRNNQYLIKLIGDSYNGMEERDSAMVYYSIQYSINPQDHNTLNKICNILLNKNKIDTVINLTNKYIEEYNNSVDIFRVNALAYYLKQDYNTSLSKFEELLESGDETLSTYYYIGLNYYMMEQYFKAVPYLELALKIEPDNINTLYYLGTAECISGGVEEGLPFLQRGFTMLEERDSTMLFKLYSGYAQGLGYKSRHKEGLTYLQLALKYTSPNQQATANQTIFNMATFYEKMKEYRKANDHYVKYMKLEEARVYDDPAKLQKSKLYIYAKNRVEALKPELFMLEN